MHVADPPGVWRVLPGARRSADSGSVETAVEWLPGEVRLRAPKRIAKGRRGGRAGATGVFPLCLRGQAKRPSASQCAALSRACGESRAKELRFAKVHPVDRIVITKPEFGAGFAIRERSN